MLPGQIRKIRQADQTNECETESCGNTATHYLCIEADSFGEELEEFCDGCIKDIRKEQEEAGPTIAFCDYCNTEGEVRPMRDPDEGSHGPVYDLCNICADKVSSQEY